MLNSALICADTFLPHVASDDVRTEAVFDWPNSRPRMVQAWVASSKKFDFDGVAVDRVNWRRRMVVGKNG